MKRYVILERNGMGEWVRIGEADTARLACDAIDSMRRDALNRGVVFGVQEQGQAVREYGKRQP